MVNNEAATSRFLLDAANLLAGSSPQVSAQLNATRRDLQRDLELNTTEKAFACNACGTLLVSGWNCKTVTGGAASRRRRTRQDRLASRNANKTFSVQCSSCNSITRIASQKPEFPQSRAQHSRDTKSQSRIPENVPGPQTQSASLTTSSATAPASTAEVGAKKRNRNKKSSLQSLLAGYKPAESKKGFGLDLMDFMKG